MKGNYGYFATIAAFITGFSFLLYMTERNPAVNHSLGVYMIILVVLAGFIGGFVAPYHVKKNVFRSVATIVGVAIVFLVFLYLMLQQGSGTTDPVTGFGLTLVIFILVIGTIFVSLVGIVLVSGRGVIGALFGRQVFPMENFEDFDFIESDYEEYY